MMLCQLSGQWETEEGHTDMLVHVQLCYRLPWLPCAGGGSVGRVVRL